MNKKILYLLTLTLLLQISTNSAQQSGNTAGRVAISFGTVIARDEDNNTRELNSSSEIYAGDTIETEDRSIVQLRMVDSALISLGCESSLKIEDYWYEESEDDRVTLRLLIGQLRTITGAIGEQDLTQYRFLLGETRVEIRGTDFEIFLNESGTAYIGNYDGGVTVVNAHGSVDLGIGGDVDFAVVEPGQAPRALTNQPQYLGRTALIVQSAQNLSGSC